MKITIIYDNQAWEKGKGQADWGFSCLVEVENALKILFDTGAKGSILLRNMKKLELNPRDINEIFISHAHWDHTGGLLDFLRINKEVKVYVPTSFRESLSAKEVIYVREPIKIHENVFSTGELGGIEQSLLVKTEEGLVGVVGCSHPGIGNILKAASNFGEVKALIGGLHGFREFALIKNLEFICPCHCTQFQSEIRLLYPEKYIGGGVGKVIQF